MKHKPKPTTPSQGALFAELIADIFSPVQPAEEGKMQERKEVQERRDKKHG